MTGKWNSDQMNDWNVTQIDNRDADRIDITDEYYHEKYDTITCPHCGCTLSAFVVMPFHYCYVCGGQFGKVVLKKDFFSDDAWLDALAGLEDCGKGMK